jgi:tripartite-type tricarboxylate transporter receptor subunit TctC
VQMMFSLTATAQPQIASGTLRGIGISAREPSPFVPGIPSLVSALGGFEVIGWNGFVAPRGTPGPIIAKLNAAIRQGLEDEELRQRVLATGYEPTSPNTPDEFEKFIGSDTVKWIDVVERLKLRAH